MLETEIITKEVKKRLGKGVILEWSRETGDFVSAVFTRQKKDGTFKTILILHKKMKFFIKDFFSKCDQIRSFLPIWSPLLKKSLMESFIFCVV